LRTFNLELEMRTIADIDRGRDRPLRRLFDEARGAGNAELHRHVALRLGGLGPGYDIEIFPIAQIGAPERQKLAVGFAEDASDIFFENPGEIAALTNRVLIGALMFPAGEQIDAAPNNGDDCDAQLGRRLPKCAQLLCRSG
jgi:hypothetical protein